MMKIKIIALLVYFALVLAQSSVNSESDPDEVQKLVSKIEEFIEKANNYTLRTDNSAFNKRVEDDDVSYSYRVAETDKCRSKGKYDFIVIGSSSGGSVVTSRLTENRKWRVLLIEAGVDASDVTQIPGLQNYLTLSDSNWGYKSTPQNFSQFGYINYSSVFPSPQIVGGASSINSMMYIRGNAFDYDQWGTDISSEWSYLNILQSFKKAENVNFTNYDIGYHGHDGPMNVQQSNQLNNLSQAILIANQELGRPIIDYNGHAQLGFSKLQTNQRAGARDSVANAYLTPAKNRPNLYVQKNSLVTKIIIENDSAEGVEFVSQGIKYCAYATNEVILSGDAVNSPQLLMLSGIGPQAQLESLNIPVLKNLPGVGKNLWDHICVGWQYFTTNLTSVQPNLTEQVIAYLQGNGDLTTANFIQSVGFTSTSNDSYIPDIQHTISARVVPNYTYEYYEKAHGITREVYDNAIAPNINKAVWSSCATLLHPKSRGTITLKSKDWTDFPNVDPNYLSDENSTDLNTLVKAYKQVIEISNTTTMQQFNSTMFNIYLEGCSQYLEGTDDYFACRIRYLASSTSNLAGTNKMGSAEDPMAVVDNDLNVFGVRGFRIVDQSVIPNPTSGNPDTTAIMMAEVVSNKIKSKYNAL